MTPTTQTIPELTLNDGHRLPQIGFGTWPLNDDQARQAVKSAIDVGYRLIDTAARYGNETGVGQGIRDSSLPREEIVLTTKLRGLHHGFDAALKAFDESLERLGTDYVDLYLIHWPLPMKGLYVETWKAFVRLQKEGRARSIGVSNFEPEHIERIEAETGVRPAVNQIELHPDFSQPQLREWLTRKGIAIESWSPLGRGGLLHDPAIETLAQKHSRSVAQIILRWHVQKGLVAIPKSQNPARMAQNLDVFNFNLSADDMAALAKLDGNHRTGGDPNTYIEE